MPDKSAPRQRRAPRHGSRPNRHRDKWRINWIDFDGRRRYRSFEKYQDAANELARRKAEVAAILEGRAPRPTPTPAFRDFVEKRYIPARTEQKRSAKDDHSIFNRWLLPTFDNMPLAAITTARIEDLKGKLLEAGLSPARINNTLGLLGSVLRYAIDLEILRALPTIRQVKNHITEPTYLRTKEDVRAFLAAAHERSPEVFALYATAIYSGMRARELFGLRWSDVDFPTHLITVARRYDKATTKSGKVRHIPILDVLTPILKAWRLQNPHRLVFPTGAGTMRQLSDRLTQEIFHQV
ncbi:MAG: site-specific integrase [Candidatus Lernaella stagnicola]|nr:site-specific integrase [Candidatus Lernaella stagnicola]